MSFATSGTIKLVNATNGNNGIVAYFASQKSAPHSLSQFYRGGTYITAGASSSIPTSGMIRFSNFYGTSIGSIIYSSNLLVNGNFASGNTAWTSSAGWNTDSTPRAVTDGSGYGYGVNPTGFRDYLFTSYPQNQVISQQVSISAPTSTFRFSYWASTGFYNNNLIDQHYGYASFYNSSGTLLEQIGTTTYQSAPLNNWTKYTYTTSVNMSTVSYVIVRLSGYDPGTWAGQYGAMITNVVVADTILWYPTNVTGLQNFYEADIYVYRDNTTYAISQWGDFSGIDRHATQSTSANQPILSATTLNGKPMINFGYTAGKILNASSFTGTAVTIGVVLYLTLSTSFNTFFASSNNPWVAGDIHLQFLQNTRTLSINTNGESSGYQPGYAFTDATPFFVIVTLSKSGTTVTRTAYINGTAYTADVQTMTSFTNFNLANINMGGWIGDTARTINGGIGSVAIYNSVLSTTDRQKLEGYFAWKWWGSGSVLPSNHPYKNTSQILI